MALPDSYTLKPNSIPAYFDAILDAQPPERFSVKFIERLGFTSTNDRLFLGILKDLGFLNRDGTPQPRYFNFMDRTQSKLVLAESIREAFSDLFAINTKANDFKIEDVRNKLRTLYAGKKSDIVINNVASTFRALCDYADFSPVQATETVQSQKSADTANPIQSQTPTRTPADSLPMGAKVQVSGLQYHINIVLPDTRDQAVYDAIFKSLRDHLA